MTRKPPFPTDASEREPFTTKVTKDARRHTKASRPLISLCVLCAAIVTFVVKGFAARFARQGTSWSHLGDFFGGYGELAIVVLLDRGDADRLVDEAERRVRELHDVHRFEQRVAPAELEAIGVADIGLALQQELRRDSGAGRIGKFMRLDRRLAAHAV